MTETALKALIGSALADEPFLSLDAAVAIRDGRRVLRRRGLAAGSALTVMIAVAVAGLVALDAGGLAGGRDRLYPAASGPPSPSSPDPSPTSDVGRRYTELLLAQVAGRFTVTRTWVFTGPSVDPEVIPGIPRRVSLALGDQGWVSLLTGSPSPFTGAPCAHWTAACAATRAPDGTLTVTFAPATPAGWHSLSSNVIVILPNGRWVSATASNAPLDGNGSAASPAINNPLIPLDLSQLRRLAEDAAADLR